MVNLTFIAAQISLTMLGAQPCRCDCLWACRSWGKICYIPKAFWKRSFIPHRDCYTVIMNKINWRWRDVWGTVLENESQRIKNILIWGLHFIIIIIVIVIYHNFLPPPRRGSPVKSDNTHNRQHTPLSPCTWHLRPFYSLSQPHHVTAWHPSPGHNIE